MRQSCQQCESEIDVGTACARVTGTGVRLYCSPACAAEAARGPAPAPVEIAAAPPRRFAHALRLSGAALVAAFALANLSMWPGASPALDEAAAADGHELAPVVAPPVEEQPLLGPAWPPVDPQWWAALSDHTWVHPLPGPYRRMPGRTSRTFGAARPGDRPAECRSGHCGVDVGDVWGEPVLAAHDGVVTLVQRDAGHPRGGLYVELGHRNDTVFTRYFHLAAIPRHLRPGTAVEAGQLIGLLGDTGVHHSEPHLHFTIAVAAAPGEPRRYIDPEPLLSLWPLAVPLPLPGSARYLVVANGAPGLPVGAGDRRPRRRRAAVPEPSPSTEPMDAPAEPAAAPPAAALDAPLAAPSVTP